MRWLTLRLLEILGAACLLLCCAIFILAPRSPNQGGWFSDDLASASDAEIELTLKKAAIGVETASPIYSERSALPYVGGRLVVHCLQVSGPRPFGIDTAPDTAPEPTQGTLWKKPSDASAESSGFHSLLFNAGDGERCFDGRSARDLYFVRLAISFRSAKVRFFSGAEGIFFDPLSGRLLYVLFEQ